MSNEDTIETKTESKRENGKTTKPRRKRNVEYECHSVCLPKELWSTMEHSIDDVVTHNTSEVILSLIIKAGAYNPSKTTIPQPNTIATPTNNNGTTIVISENNNIASTSHSNPPQSHNEPQLTTTKAPTKETSTMSHTEAPLKQTAPGWSIENTVTKPPTQEDIERRQRNIDYIRNLKGKGSI